MASRSKNYQEAVKLLDRTRAYPPQEAIMLAKKMAEDAIAAVVQLIIIVRQQMRR